MPSNEDLMDPDSPHFTTDWWQICEILPPDPWAYIVSDFQWSNEIILEAQATKIKFSETDIGHFPGEKGTNAHIGFALNTAIKLYRDIESQISVKSVDIDFVKDWGEYQKSIVILHSILPNYQRESGLKKQRQDVSRAAHRARGWYALWFTWFKKKPSVIRPTRDRFENFFLKLLQDILSEKRSVLSEYKDDVKRLASQILQPSDTNDGFEIRLFYTANKFYGKALKGAINVAAAEAQFYPPADESFYPFKK